MEARLNKLRTQLERRKKAKSEIVELEVKVLVNEAEGLGFSPVPSRGPGNGEYRKVFKHRNFLAPASPPPGFKTVPPGTIDFDFPLEIRPPQDPAGAVPPVRDKESAVPPPNGAYVGPKS